MSVVLAVWLLQKILPLALPSNCIELIILNSMLTCIAIPSYFVQLQENHDQEILPLNEFGDDEDFEDLEEEHETNGTITYLIIYKP